MKTIKRLRRGFTLLEITVAAVIVAVLAAVTVPSMISYLEFQEIKATRDMLVMLSNAIADPTTGANSFYLKVGVGAGSTTVYPGRLSELTTPIAAATGSPPNSCGNLFTSTQVTAWGNSGPFVSMVIPTTGLPTPIGLIENTLVRNPTNNVAGTLSMKMLAQPLANAQELDYLIDANASGVGDGGTAGTLRWTGTGPVDISYNIAVGAKC